MSAAVAAIGLAAMHATLTLADRSEARVRNTLFPDQPAAVADFDTSPSARLDVHTRVDDTYLLYAPRFTLRSVNFESSTEVLHRGTAATTWRASRRTTIALLEDAAYGIQDFSALLFTQPTTTGQPPPVDRLPVSQTIHFAATRSAFTLTNHPSTRWRLIASAEYFLSGGVADVDRAIFPLEKGIRGYVEAERALGRRDGEVTTLRGTRSSFDAAGFRPDARNAIVDLLEGWRHRWSRSTETTIAGGLSAVVLELPSSGLDLYPLVEGTLLHRDAEDRLDVRWVARMVTYIDRLRGIPDYQAQSTLGVTYSPWTTRAGFAFRAQLGFAQSVPTTKHDAIRILMGEVGASYRASRHVLFEIGARGMEQKIRDEADVPFVAAGFLAATFTTDPLRL